MPSAKIRILADVNLWLATVFEAHPHHRQALGWWRTEVVPARRQVCFCRMSQLGLLRLLTNETVMGPSRREPDQAWADYEQLLEQRVVGLLEEPDGLQEMLRTYSSTQPPSPRLWTDAYFAAFATVAGLELVTFDRGFRRFEGVALTNLG